MEVLPGDIFQRLCAEILPQDLLSRQRLVEKPCEENWGIAQGFLVENLNRYLTQTEISCGGLARRSLLDTLHK